MASPSRCGSREPDVAPVEDQVAACRRGPSSTARRSRRTTRGIEPASRHDRREAGRERHHETGAPAWRSVRPDRGAGRLGPEGPRSARPRSWAANGRPVRDAQAGSATVTRRSAIGPDEVRVAAGRAAASPAAIDPAPRSRRRAAAPSAARSRAAGRRPPHRRPSPVSVDRPAEQRAAAAQVAGRDRGPDRRAADRPAVEVERRDDDDVEPVARPELGQRGRRPAPLEAERRVGRHEEPAQRDARADPLDERVVRRLAQRRVEVLDDRDRDAGRRQPLEPLRRVEQERRRAARSGPRRDGGRT